MDILKYINRLTETKKIEIPESLAVILEVQMSSDGLYYADPDICISISDCCKAIHYENMLISHKNNLNNEIIKEAS